MRRFGFGVLVLGMIAFCSPVLAAPGDLDATFGQGGVVVLDAPPGLYASFTAVDVAADGSIAAAGSIDIPGAVFGNGTDMLVAKLTPGGDLDPNFNGGQQLRLAWPGNLGSYARAIAFTPDGKIVVAGSSHPVAEETVSRHAVARLNQDGTLDRTFGPGGVGAFEVPVPGAVEAEPVDLAVQPDGRIVLAGAVQLVSAKKPLVVRLRSDGTPDPTFDQDGVAIVPLGTPSQGGNAVGVAIGADGRITTAGNWFSGFNSGGIVVRHLPDGRLDPDFRASPAVEGFTASGPPQSAFWGVGVLPDGRAVAGGIPGNLGAHVFAMRHLPSSATDTTYNTNSSHPGTATLTANFSASFRAVHVDGTGRAFFAVAGSRPPLGTDFVLMLIEADGRPSAALGGGSGIRRYPVRMGALENPSAIQVDTDARIVMAGQLQDPVNTPNRPMVMRLEPVPPGSASAPPPATVPTGAPGSAVKGTPAGATPTAGAAPRLAVTAKKKQDVDRLSVSLEFDGVGKATATGTVIVPRSSRVYRFKSASRSVAPNRRVTLRLKLARGPLRAVKRTLSRKKLFARITVTVNETAGNRIARTERVQLKR